jgi:hypothetical protein
MMVSIFPLDCGGTPGDKLLDSNLTSRSAELSGIVSESVKSYFDDVQPRTVASSVLRMN